MAKIKIESKDVTEIKSALETKKLILGTERVLKELKRGNLSKIFLSSNCPENIMDDINYYVSLNEIQVISLDMHNEDLGIVCKKPFAVSVLGFMKWLYEN